MADRVPGSRRICYSGLFMEFGETRSGFVRRSCSFPHENESCFDLGVLGALAVAVSAVPETHTNSRSTCATMCFFCTFRPEGTILPARHPGNPASFACLAMLVTYEISKPSVIHPYLSVFLAPRSCDPGMTFAFHGQRRSRISFRRESIGRRQVLKQFVEQPHL